MQDSSAVFTPKFPSARIPSIRRLLTKFDLPQLSKEELEIYEDSRYAAKVLFVPWALSTVSERLALDLFAICFVLGAGRDRYSSTRSLLNAYHHASWLKKHDVTSQDITVIKFESWQFVSPAPTIQNKSKRLRYDIGALGVKNDKGSCDIQIPASWRHFQKHKRELFRFCKSLDDGTSNLVPLAISAIALEKNPQLKSRVDDDVNSISKRLQDLLHAYSSLDTLTLQERHWNVSNRKAVLHLTAYGLFEYADWSWKPRSKLRKCISI